MFSPTINRIISTIPFNTKIGISSSRINKEKRVVTKWNYNRELKYQRFYIDEKNRSIWQWSYKFK